jgi:hypothetical protein
MSGALKVSIPYHTASSGYPVKLRCLATSLRLFLATDNVVSHTQVGYCPQETPIRLVRSVGQMRYYDRDLWK